MTAILLFVYFLNTNFAVVNQGEVSTEPNTLTQTWHNVFLAHNHLAGALFDKLAIGDEIIVSGKSYHVTEISRYQVADDYIDLATGEHLTTSQIFWKYYSGENVTLQTCIAKDGDPAWGRLFITAK
jgi:hypothetical protein